MGQQTHFHDSRKVGKSRDTGNSRELQQEQGLQPETLETTVAVGTTATAKIIIVTENVDIYSFVDFYVDSQSKPLLRSTTYTFK
jgi:hypothetical protein